MFDISKLATDLISKNPNVVNNPQAQNMLDAIKSGDNKTGEEIARNLCNTYGVTPEDAVKQAKAFFHL